MYRIIQESLQNIIKHAKANEVVIDFLLEDNQILLKIKDNGKGFDKNKNVEGIGVKNINSRVKDINGVLNIKSQKGKGTLIQIVIPYEEVA